MSLHSSSAGFRTARALLTAGSVLGMAAIGFPGPASAQQISKATQELTRRVFSDPRITVNTDCGEYKKQTGNGFGVDALCEVRVGELLKQQRRALRAEGRALQADGRKLDRENAALRHEGEVLRQQGRVLEAQERALDRENVQLDDLLACKKFLVDGIAAKTIIQTEMLKLAGGKIDRSNLCPVARAYGFAGKRADLGGSKLELSQR